MDISPDDRVITKKKQAIDLEYQFIQVISLALLVVYSNYSLMIFTVFVIKGESYSRKYIPAGRDSRLLKPE